MTGKRVTFTVSFLQPDAATVRDCQEYIRSALKTEIGLLSPEHNMAGFDRETIIVSLGRANHGND